MSPIAATPTAPSKGPQPPPARSLAYGALLLAVLGAASSSIWIRLSAAPSLTLAFWRLALTVLILAGPLLIRYRSELRRITRRDFGLMAASGAFLAVHFAAWVASLRYTSVASSTVLVTTHPFLVMAVGAWLFGERAPATAVAGVLLAVVGGAMVGWGDFTLGGTALYGDLLAFLGALTIAGYILIGRAVRQRVGLLPYAVTVYTAAALVLLLMSLLTGTPVTGYPAREWGLFFALAAFPTILGHTVMNWALKYVRAAVVSVSILGEPVGASILAFAIFAEMPGVLSLAGGALILMGIAVFVVAVEARGSNSGSQHRVGSQEG